MKTWCDCGHLRRTHGCIENGEEAGCTTGCDCQLTDGCGEPEVATMTDRDRLADDLHTMHDRIVVDGKPRPCWCQIQADHLIALGWTRLDEERLARALIGFDVTDYQTEPHGTELSPYQAAAAIAKAYREDA